MEKIKVLIADDMQMIAETIKNIVLKNENFEVVGIAANGKEELDMIYSLKPDIVFTDNQMPEMNGIDVIENIYKSNLELKPKFILVTGDTYRELYNKCAELDVITVLNKPISSDRISYVLDDISSMEESSNETIETKDNITSKNNNSIFTRIINKIKGGN